MGVSTNIIFDLMDVTAKNDAELSLDFDSDGSIRPAYPLDNVLIDTEKSSFATLEKNSFVLNEGLDFEDKINSEEPWYKGTISTILSDWKGEFSSPIIVDIAFNKPHTSAGITILFRNRSVL